MSLLECIVFSMGQPNTAESNISGFGWAFKEQARPLFMGVFAHRSDVPFRKNEKVPKKTKINGKDGWNLPRI